MKISSFNSKNFVRACSVVLCTLLCSCSNIVDTYQIDYDKQQNKIKSRNLYRQDKPLLQEDAHINLLINNQAKNSTIELHDNTTIVQSQTNKVALDTLKPAKANELADLKPAKIELNSQNLENKKNIYQSNYRLDSRSILNRPNNPGYYFPRINSPIKDTNAPRQVY